MLGQLFTEINGCSELKKIKLLLGLVNSYQMRRHFVQIPFEIFYIHIVSVLAVLGKESDSDNPSYKRISIYLPR